MNYNVVRNDRSKDSGKKRRGVLTCIRNGLAYRVLDCESKLLEVLLVEIFQEDKSRLILLIFIILHGMVIEKEEMSGILKNLKGNAIICGDLNGHNSLWVVKKMMLMVMLFLKSSMIDDLNLVCLNDESGTRIDKSTGKISCLDLALVTMNITPKCTWVVGDDFWESDHFPIKVSTHS